MTTRSYGCYHKLKYINIANNSDIEIVTEGGIKVYSHGTEEYTKWNCFTVSTGYNFSLYLGYNEVSWEHSLHIKKNKILQFEECDLKDYFKIELDYKDNVIRVYNDSKTLFSITLNKILVTPLQVL